MKKTLLILAFFLPLTALAAYVVPQGGTGQSTLPASQLLTGNGANAIYGTATTTASCSGSASCSPFTVLGSMPITISATAGTTYTGTYPISVTGSVISTVATSSLGLTTASFASPNISQWTNNSGYLTANQSITLSGDITGSGATSIATTLATVNSNVGTFTYPSITVNGKGLITAASSLTPVTSIKQTFGTAQTGAITLATTSASFNGLTVADAITNSSGTFTIAPQWSGTLNNSGLTNPSLTVNTASPLGGGGSVSLGGTLNLTCSTCLTSAGAVTSIAQTYGTAQTGAITFATSTDSFNGLSANELITNTGGAFTFANNITGLLSVAGGGTGVGTQTTNGVNFYNGTNITSGTGLSSAGAVGIGTSTPWTTGFGSVGTVAMSGLGAATAGNDVLCINPTTFKVLPGGSGTSCAVSNEKYKQDIASSTVGIAELMQLDPVVYYFDNASTSGGEPAQQIGLLANQAYTVDPRLTQQDASGTPNALRLDDIEGLLIKSVQDIWNHDTVQDQQIATLQEQVAALQTEMSACTKP